MTGTIAETADQYILAFSSLNWSSPFLLSTTSFCFSNSRRSRSSTSCRSSNDGVPPEAGRVPWSAAACKRDCASIGLVNIGDSIRTAIAASADARQAGRVETAVVFTLEPPEQPFRIAAESLLREQSFLAALVLETTSLQDHNGYPAHTVSRGRTRERISSPEHSPSIQADT